MQEYAPNVKLMTLSKTLGFMGILSFETVKDRNIKKSDICIAIIGANTEPIRYKNPVISSIGNIIAPKVPIIVTATAIHFDDIFANIDSVDTPAEYTSKNVVVTVENTTIKSPIIPSLAFNKICDISDSIVNNAALIPITYIQTLTRPCYSTCSSCLHRFLCFFCIITYKRKPRKRHCNR